MTERLHNESGYSLVEVLAAIVILTIAIIPMVTMFDTGLRSATTSGNYDKSRSLANKQLETIKGMDFESVTSEYPPASSPRSCEAGTFDDSVFGCEVETTYVYADAASGSFRESGAGDPEEMMRVVVTATWSGGEYNATGLAGQ